MKEEWKDIVGYEEKYQISNKGRVRSIHYHRSSSVCDKCLKPRKPAGRYPYVALSKDGKVHRVHVHRLVALYFVPNPDNKPQVNHKNGDKADNRAENLEWVTARENTLHARNVLKKKLGGRYKFNLNKSSKKVAQFYVDEKGREYKIAVYTNAQAAALVNKLHASAIRECCIGNKNYTHCGGFLWKYEKEGGSV